MGILVLVATLVAAASPSSAAVEWPGWRGQDREGRSDSQSGPRSWSGATGQGIRWRATFPGEGCSSPVISGDRLFITSGHTHVESTSLGGLLRWVAIALVGVAAALGTRRITVQFCVAGPGERSVWRVFSAVASLAALLTLAVIVLWGDHWLDFGRCPIRAWLGTCITAIVCLLLGRFNLSGRGKSLVHWGLFALVLALVIPLGIPCRDHVYRGGAGGAQACLVAMVASVPGSAGLLWLLQSFRLWRVSRRNRQLSNDAVDLPTAMARGAGLRLLGREVCRRPSRLLVGVAIVAAVCLLNVLMFRLDSASSPVPGPTFQGSCLQTLVVVFVIAALLALVFPPRTCCATVANPSRRQFWLTWVGLGAVTGALLFGAYRLLCELIHGSEFLLYHLEKMLAPPWVGRTGMDWAPLAVFLACAIATLAFTSRLPYAANRWETGAALALLALLPCLVLLHTVVLHASEELVRAIVCIDCESGRSMWQTTGLPGPEGVLHRLNTPATPTPVIERERIIAYFGSAGVMCCDKAGRVLWTNPSINYQSVYGVGASLAAADGVVVLANLMPKEPQLYGLSAESGTVLWNVLLDSDGMEISGCSRTPLIKRLRNEMTVLIWLDKTIEGFSLTTGRRLWSYAADTGSSDHVACLVSDAARLYCVGTKKTVAYALDALGGAESPIVWEADVHGPNCASPIVAHGLLFFVSDSGTARCLECDSGRLVWKHRLRGKYYSSPVVMGDQLYFTNLAGYTTVLRAARDMEVLSECNLATDMLASPAPVADSLYFRGSHEVFRVEQAALTSQRPIAPSVRDR